MAPIPLNIAADNGKKTAGDHRSGEADSDSDTDSDPEENAA